jgi:uncharacterized membrane protein YphA (DoxX/SURF4 family)
MTPTAIPETPTRSFPAVPALPSAKTLSRFGLGATRMLLGLLFAVTGLNGFLDFLPHPTEPMPEKAAAFAGALMATYLLRLLAGTQLVAGALLLTNRFVPLALALLAPVVVNIFAFHLFLAPQGLGLAIVLALAEAGLAFAYRSSYRPLFAARAAR